MLSTECNTSAILKWKSQHNTFPELVTRDWVVLINRLVSFQLQIHLKPPNELGKSLVMMMTFWKLKGLYDDLTFVWWHHLFDYISFISLIWTFCCGNGTYDVSKGFFSHFDTKWSSDESCLLWYTCDYTYLQTEDLVMQCDVMCRSIRSVYSVVNWLSLHNVHV